MSKSDQGTDNNLRRYRMIPRTLIFLTHGSDVLFIKGAPDKRLWPNRYNGIGGHVEPGESILDAARRELEEEAGITKPPALYLRGVVTIDTDSDPGILLFIFTGQAPNRTTQESAEGTLEWVNWRALPREAMVEDLPVLLERLLSAPAASEPFYAHYSYDEQDHLQVRFS